MSSWFNWRYRVAHFQWSFYRTRQTVAGLALYLLGYTQVNAFYQRYTAKNNLDQAREHIKHFDYVPPNPQLFEERENQLKAKKRGVRILCIDGHGVNGLLGAILLEEIERRMSEKKGEQVFLADHFDLVCSTGNGALMAMAHAKKRLSMYDTKRMFEMELGFDLPFKLITHADTILYSLLNSDYFTEYGDVAYYQRLLNLFIRDIPMKSEEVTEPKICLVACRYDNHEDYLFANYSETKERNVRINDEALAKVALRASGATPLYFPSYYLEDGTRLVDGGQREGYSTHKVAYQQAKFLWPDSEIDVLLSVGLGTGSERHPAAPVEPIQSLRDGAWQRFDGPLIEVPDWKAFRSEVFEVVKEEGRRYLVDPDVDLQLDTVADMLLTNRTPDLPVRWKPRLE